MSYILNANPKEATEITKKYNQNIKENVNLHYLEEEKKDIEELKSHFIYELGKENITDTEGNVRWNRKQQDYLRKEAPDTVNPYLWQIAQDGLWAGVVELIKDKV